MIVYHGTDSLESKEKILKEGLNISRNGMYGPAIYCTSDRNLALQYADNDEERLIEVELDVDHVFSIEYNKITNEINHTRKRNIKFENAQEAPLVKYLSRFELGRKGAFGIRYADTNEVLITDKSIIKSYK